MASGISTTQYAARDDMEYLKMHFRNFMNGQVFSGSYQIEPSEMKIATAALKVLFFNGSQQEFDTHISSMTTPELKRDMTILQTKGVSERGGAFSILRFLPRDVLQCDVEHSAEEIDRLKHLVFEGAIVTLACHLPEGDVKARLALALTEGRLQEEPDIIADVQTSFTQDESVPSWLRQLVHLAQSGDLNKLCTNWPMIRDMFSKEQLNPVAEDPDTLAVKCEALVIKFMQIASDPDKFRLFLEKWPCSTEEFIKMPLPAAELALVLFTQVPQIDGVPIQQIVQSFPDALTSFLTDRYNKQAHAVELKLRSQDAGQIRGINTDEIVGVQDVLVGLANLLKSGFSVDLLTRLSQNEPEKLTILLLYGTKKCCLAYKNMKDLLEYHTGQLIVAVRGYENLQPLVVKYRMELKDILKDIPKDAPMHGPDVLKLLAVIGSSYLHSLLDRNIAFDKILNMQINWQCLVEEQAQRLGPRAFKRAVYQCEEESFILSDRFVSFLRSR